MVAVKNFFVWMLIAWVASGPSALAWHHALEHSGLTNHSAGCCAVKSGNTSANAIEACISSTEAPCPFGFGSSDKTETDSLVATDTSLTGTSIRGGDDECRICELLLHSDLAVYGNEFVDFGDVAYSSCDEIVVSLPFKRWFGTWSVRGPPSC
jgi:hypothetical protein